MAARVIPIPNPWCTEVKGHLLIEVNECLIGQLERLYGLQHRVPVAMVDLRHKALDAVHRVEGDTALLLRNRVHREGGGGGGGGAICREGGREEV